ncbi:hypothetical protein [Nonomuraea sp. NPDC049709]|uniref:hypothetical protein n=1 Tax=Nonomuraea sp. NPDC049709 TaxID=3154736 RepID=UPI003416193F
MNSPPGRRRLPHRPRRPLRPPGRHRLPARHRPSYATTDWPQVLRLYDALLTAWPSPSSHSTAPWHSPWSPDPLHELDTLEHGDRLTGYHYLSAIRADLLRHHDAATAYRTGLDLADNQAERDFLAARLTETTNAAEG